MTSLTFENTVVKGQIAFNEICLNVSDRDKDSKPACKVCLVLPEFHICIKTTLPLVCAGGATLERGGVQVDLHFLGCECSLSSPTLPGVEG